MLTFVVELIIIRVRGLSRTVGAKSDVGLIQTPPSCTKAQFSSGKWSLSMRVLLLLLREGSGNRISGVACINQRIERLIALRRTCLATRQCQNNARMSAMSRLN